MIIKTSNGITLLNSNLAPCIGTDNTNSVYAFMGENSIILLGKYNNEENAKKVLDDLMCAMEKNESVYIMPQEDEVDDIEIGGNEGDDFCENIRYHQDNNIYPSRRYLFRAKQTTSREWIYGSLDENCACIETDNSSVAVDLSTVGMYIGLDDIEGKKIFEGDIVSFEINNFFDVGEVKYDSANFCYIIYSFELLKKYAVNKFMCKILQVIGNIYDSK